MSKKALLLGIVIILAVGFLVKLVFDVIANRQVMAPENTEIVVNDEPALNPENALVDAPREVPKMDSPKGESETMENKTATVSTSYMSPAGKENVKFVIVVDEKGIITKAETEVLARADRSIELQTQFKNELPGVVVGKSLDSLTGIDRVGKASLTTKSFNESLAALKQQI